MEEAARAYARAYLRENSGPPGSGTMALQKAPSDEDADYEEEEASSLRPAKRARVATSEDDSGHSSRASAPGQEEQQQPLQAERGLFP